MRPVRTQTGTTSDRSPYRCLFLFTWSRSEKSSHAGFTHSGCWTDTNDSDRSEVAPRNHGNTNWFETGQEIIVLSMRESVFGQLTGTEESKENQTRWILRMRWLRIWLKHWKHQRQRAIRHLLLFLTVLSLKRAMFVRRRDGLWIRSFFSPLAVFSLAVLHLTLKTKALMKQITKEK